MNSFLQVQNTLAQTRRRERQLKSWKSHRSIQELIETIRELMTPEDPPRVRIGFQLPAGKAKA